VRQLRNITEQICVLEEGPLISKDILARYLPNNEPRLPMLLGSREEFSSGMSERDIFYKVLVDLRKDVNDLKRVVFGLLEGGSGGQASPVNPIPTAPVQPAAFMPPAANEPSILRNTMPVDEDEFIEAEEASGVVVLSLEQQELEMIRKALQRHKGKRRDAAQELGISERTLYRKIKQYELED